VLLIWIVCGLGFSAPRIALNVTDVDETLKIGGAVTLSVAVIVRGLTPATVDSTVNVAVYDPGASEPGIALTLMMAGAVALEREADNQSVLPPLYETAVTERPSSVPLPPFAI
jgi:hypothetical protein